MVDVKRWPVQDLDLDLLDGQEENPNELRGDEFSALVDAMKESGFMDPIQVVGPNEQGRYVILGGHHRVKAAKLLDMGSVPSVVVPPEEFSQDQREIELIRLNTIKGQLNPEKFTALFNKLAKKYDVDVLRRMMAFTKTDAFNKVYLDAKRALPPDMQEQLEKMRDEIKTVDDLSLVLNTLFTQYGNSLDSNFMVFTHGGKESIMVRLVAPGAWQRFKKLSQWCMENRVRMDEEMMARMDWPDLSKVKEIRELLQQDVEADKVGSSVILR